VNPTGHYELRDHPTLAGLVALWWCPNTGPATPSNINFAQERIPLLAEALAEWELSHTVPPPRHEPGRLRIVGEDGSI
jgi:hypothetical protein